MIFTETILPGSFIVELMPKGDSRGWFVRTFCKNEFEQIGHSKEWVQMNHSYTARKGTIRGMHFQRTPNAEIKMVRCIAGAIYDVIIDLRKGSTTYLQWFGTELSAVNKKMIYIPEGFAHGFQTLADNSELIYQHSQFYEPGAEEGILHNDTALGIQWPLQVTEVSGRDKLHPIIDSNFKAI
ncbi:MAG: dTDP-4-dehydrorhamnose 3,5-epimerase [Ferruginibacter sp.]